MARPLLATGVALVLFASAVRADYLEVDRKTAVRSQSDSSSSRVRDAVAGEMLPLLDNGTQQNGYYHVRLTGSQSGWIYRTFVRRHEGDIPGAPAVGPVAPVGPVVTAGGTVAFTGAFVSQCALPYGEFAQEGIDVDASCPAEGTGNAGSQAQNRMKNNLCAKAPALPMTFADFATLQTEADKLNIKHGSNLDPDRSSLRNVTFIGDREVGEGSLVRLSAFVMKAHHSNVSSGETVNCKLKGKDNNDVHIVLMPDAPAPQKKLDECKSVTAEMIPHFRPWFWEPLQLLNQDRPLRFTGNLLYDAAHRPCRDGKGSPKRAASWEIHPVYAVDVCNETTLAQCPASDDSKWKPLHVFNNLEEEHDEDVEPGGGS